MSLAQSFRPSAGKAAVVTLAGLLALSASLPFNAEAQQAKSAPTTQATQTTTMARNTATPLAATQPTTQPTRVATADTTEQPTLIREAGDYSRQNKVVSIIVYKGKQNEGGLTGDDIAQKISEYFSRNEIPSKAFVGESTSDFTTVGYSVRGRLYGPYGLKNSAVAAVSVASYYRDLYAALPAKGPALAAVAPPTPHQE